MPMQFSLAYHQSIPPLIFPKIQTFRFFPHYDPPKFIKIKPKIDKKKIQDFYEFMLD